MRETKHFIGRQASGDRVYVEIKTSAVRAGNFNTLDHERMTRDGVRISISGFVIEKGRRNASSAGQILDDIKRVTDPAPGWSRDAIRNLARIWQYWHLNDMRAGCIHERNRQDCPVGYRTGQAWLYEAPDDDTLRAVEQLQSLPTGDVPSSY